MQATQTTQTTPAGETYDQTVNTFSTLQDQLVDMAEGFVRAVPGLVIALFILLLTWIIAKFAVRIADRLTAGTEIRPSLKQLIDTIVRLTIWIVGLMIALIIKRVLYLKADALSKDDFVSEGLAAFEYHKQGKPYTLSYYEAPETVFDDLDAMHKWGNNAYGAALRAAAKKRSW